MLSRAFRKNSWSSPYLTQTTLLRCEKFDLQSPFFSNRHLKNNKHQIYVALPCHGRVFGVSFELMLQRSKDELPQSTGVNPPYFSTFPATR